MEYGFLAVPALGRVSTPRASGLAESKRVQPLVESGEKPLVEQVVASLVPRGILYSPDPHHRHSGEHERNVLLEVNYERVTLYYERLLPSRYSRNPTSHTQINITRSAVSPLTPPSSPSGTHHPNATQSSAQTSPPTTHSTHESSTPCRCAAQSSNPSAHPD